MQGEFENNSSEQTVAEVKQFSLAVTWNLSIGQTEQGSTEGNLSGKPLIVKIDSNHIWRWCVD